MSKLVCPKCNRPKQEWALVCWKCHTDELLSAAYERGLTEGENKASERAFQSGYKIGMVDGAKKKSQQGPDLSLTKARWKQLVQLVHPDKHAGSRAANEIMQWLNAIKP